MKALWHAVQYTETEPKVLTSVVSSVFGLQFSQLMLPTLSFSYYFHLSNKDNCTCG